MKEIKHFYQTPDFGCGAASLLIAYRALGIEYNEVSLTLELGTTKDGTSWFQMIEHTAMLGFPTEFKNQANYKDLQKNFKNGVEVIAWSTDGNAEPQPHFSVISGITNDLIELTDPGRPPEDWPSIMTKEEFLSKWFITDYARSYLLIKPKSA